MTEPTVRFYMMPAEGPITGMFGQQYVDGPNTWSHRGVDIGCPIGTPVRAPAAGVVVQPFNDGSFGTAVCLDHGDGWHTIYAHLSRADVAIGEKAPKGLQLGLSGDTGHVRGAHLHWQLSDSPTFPADISHSRDPLRYLDLEEPMTYSERGLLAVANHPDYTVTLASHEALVAAGFTPSLPPFPNTGDLADMNALRLREKAIEYLATSDVAEQAYKAIGG